MPEYCNWTSHGEDIVQDYFEAPSVPQVSEEPTPTGHVEAGSSYFASSHEGVLDDGTRSFPMDGGPSLYCYGGGPYDYDESGLANRFSNVMHTTDQSLWDSCTISQLGIVAELVDIKADGQISERIYDRISQWANRILSSDHTLLGDYYNTKKLIKDLGLPVEKIHACTSLLEGKTHTGRSPHMLSSSTCN
ncbi:UNVERIFIED_CONTAM: hypothetical protein Sradi_0888200 [Sesamum radiatum]|uniref:Uncharacterized protein n=1 Tax=Sesamum radiatum TaxID=300843 RepID=A0AAW2V1Q6_SESRA